MNINEILRLALTVAAIFIGKRIGDALVSRVKG